MEKTYVPAYVLEPTRPAPVERLFVERAPIPDFIHRIEAGRVQLPMIARIVRRTSDALQEPEIDYRALGKAVARDPVLSAKVLRLANASLLGGRRSTASIDVAVRAIGAEVLGKLVQHSVAATELEGVVGIDLRLFWHDALVTAVAASKVAAMVGADPDEAYVCGLLHMVGHLVLCRCYPEIAEAMFGGFQMMRGHELAEVEKEAFGTDHATAGALWMASLDLPRYVVDVVRTQLTTAADKLSPLALALRSGRLLAAAVARKLAPAAALATLAPEFCARFIDDDGQVTASFDMFYNALREIKAKG